MATIVLYADKINQMPGLVQNVKQSVQNYKEELAALKSKVLKINQSICSTDDVISSIQASSQTQEEKITSLETFQQKSEEFIENTARVDSEVAEVIRQRKDDFYKQYYYLKPKCEKNGWEKFCDNCKKVGEWCKEHWVMLITIVVVVVVAVVAAIFGVAVAAIAAIAGIVSLVLCIADTICIVATGGKSISDVCREKGLGWLGQIFDGLSVGCDIVSIVLPLGAAIKTMAKVGVKKFAKISLEAIKKAFKKEIIEGLWHNGFKQGFKTGMKKFGKLVFKTFIFDIDDLTKMKDGKRVWNLMEDTLSMVGPNRHWVIDGDRLVPSTSSIPQNRYNTNRMTMAEIMNQPKFQDFPDTIPYHNGYPDLSEFSVYTVDSDIRSLNIKDLDIDTILGERGSSAQLSRSIREPNMNNAEKVLQAELGVTVEELEKICGFELTIHEDLNMRRCYFVPSEIHAAVGHTGGVANFKFNLKSIPGLTNLVGEKTFQFAPRFGMEEIASVFNDN